MGDLKAFAAYVAQCHEVVCAAKARLLDLQARFESFYQEVSAVREHELGQLAWEISRRPKGSLPEGLDAAIAQAQEKATAELDGQLAELRRTHQDFVEKAERSRTSSLELEAEVHQQNVDLDAKEELLKAENAELVQSIARYNDRIRAMGSGFGFLVNLFRMRALQTERKRIDDQHASVAARIEAVRAQWAERAKETSERQAALRAEWTDLRTRAATLQAKIDHLETTRGAVVWRTTLERVLFERHPTHLADGTGLVCARCGGDNAPTNRFCQYCAARLQEDRPDLEGSLPEIAELNHHHRRFSDGMKACQEIIGLALGLGSGLAAFAKSVDSMIESQATYPIPKLAIDVPAECVEYGKNFEQFRTAVEQSAAHHPTELAAVAAEATRRLGPDNLKSFFERMGQELSRQAEAQWGPGR